MVAEQLLAGEPFTPSENDYDWLGHGIYFWEFGLDRAFRFAVEQQRRGKVKTPAVIGAVLQLGNCFDLFDTRFTTALAAGYARWKDLIRAGGVDLPVNTGQAPEYKLRSGFAAETHIQISVRNPDCIVGVFRPRLERRTP